MRHVNDRTELEVSVPASLTTRMALLELCKRQMGRAVEDEPGDDAELGPEAQFWFEIGNHLLLDPAAEPIELQSLPDLLVRTLAHVKPDLSTGPVNDISAFLLRISDQMEQEMRRRQVEKEILEAMYAQR